MPEILTALLLGVVEGLTEFLPISSTGHLIIAGHLLGFTGPRADSFKIFIQLGAILAICWHYRARLLAVAVGLPREAEARGFVLNLLLAFLPAAILGVLFHDLIKTVLFTPRNVAFALVAGGVVMLLIERVATRPRVHTVDLLPRRLAFGIGCAQALALVPGVSRSAATIMGARALGLSHRAATEFSFFLAIPTMFAATLFDLQDVWSLLGPGDLLVYGVGFLAAFASALLAVRLLLEFISTHGFAPFAWYRIGFGCLWLLFFDGVA